MSDSTKDERERIREKKMKELLNKDGDAADASTGDGGGQAPGEPIEIRDESHLDEVLGQHDVVLVDCYAEWCGPCKMMEPTIDALAQQSEAAIAKVDVDQNQHLAGKLGVQGVPTLVLFANGEPVERLVGAQDQQTLEQLIQQAG